MTKANSAYGQRSSDGVRGIVAVVMICGALIVGATIGGGLLLATKTGDNCERIHKIVTAGAVILDTERGLREALDAGLIDRAEYEDALRRSAPFRAYRDRNLEIWRSADCPPPELD